VLHIRIDVERIHSDPPAVIVMASSLLNGPQQSLRPHRTCISEAIAEPANVKDLIVMALKEAVALATD